MLTSTRRKRFTRKEKCCQAITEISENSANDRAQTKRRKRTRGEQEEGSLEIERDVEVGLQHMSSLSLARVLHSKDLLLSRKIELAYLFVESARDEQQMLNFMFDWEKEKRWMGMPQLVSLVCYWIQSILIPSTKEKAAAQKSRDRGVNVCFDVRCWVIFKWCLQSKYLERASFSSNLMRPINFVLTAAITFPGNRQSDSGCPLVSDEHEPEMTSSGTLMKEITKVVGLLFSLHGRYFRPSLDLWASSALSAINLGESVFLREVPDEYKSVLPKFTCLVLEEFARYLGTHPNPRNVFPVIVEKLVEPLMSLLAVLEREPCSKQLSRNDIAYSWRNRLVRILEDIFAFGLFHSVHMDGYLSVCRVDGYSESRDTKENMKAKLASSRKHEREASNVTFVSYHKSLFQKLEHLRKEGKTTALQGIGKLLNIFICRKKMQGAGASQLIGTEKTKTPRISEESPEIMNINKQQQDTSHSTRISSKTSGGTAQNSNMYESKHVEIKQEVHFSKQDQAMTKPLFNLFVEFMDPLHIDLEQCERFVHSQESEKLQWLSRAQSTLVAINGLLSVVKDEKIFIPTEDTPDQAHFNYLKRIYDTVFKLGSLVPNLCLNVRSKQELLNLGVEKFPTMIMKDIVHALSYLLEIEYRVAEDKLFYLWLLLLSYLAMNSSENKEQEKSSILTSQIVYLGCQVISIYGELRQVDLPLFRLLDSIRFFIFGSYKRPIDTEHLIFLSSIDSLPSTVCVGAVVSLVCSREFLNVVAAVVAAVPEGQVAQCIRLLNVDVMETLEWMKNSCIKDDLKESQISEFQNQTNQSLTVKAEVVGKALSELYTLILDKSNVTVNNSIPVAKFVKDIVTSISLCLGTFVKKVSKHVESLWQCILSVITGTEISEDNGKNMKMQTRMSLWGSWILVFVFRLYLSSRSLYRQCISFMPPNPAKKLSLAMGDSFTACSGNDWIQEAGNMTEGGYFSWIGKSSIPVPGVLIAISESLLQGGFEKSSALSYVLLNMALQRLIDLNRHIKALVYVQDKTVRCFRAIAVNNGDLPTQCKEGKKFEKLLNVSRQEASALTDFILNYTFSFVSEKVERKSCLVDVPNNTTEFAWDSVIGTLDEHSLVTAIWQLVCQNVDIWSDHASKKIRKKFVSKLLESLLSLKIRVSSDVEFQLIKKQMGNERKVVTMEIISTELLRNAVLYEQEFCCRYLAPKICQKIRKCLPPKLNHKSLLGISSTKAVFGNLQDWPKFITILEEVGAITELEIHLCENTNDYKCGSTVMQVPEGLEENLTVTSELLFGDWINLLNFLCWLPKCFGGVKSFSMYACHILNIERFLVITLHEAQKASHSNPLAMLRCSGIRDPAEFLDLFLACRRALNSITLSYNDVEFQHIRSSLVPILFESSSSCLWLLRSIDVISQWVSQCALLQPSLRVDLKGDTDPWKHLLFSILNHTAGMLMILCEGLFNIASKSLISDVQCTSDMCKGDNLTGTIQSSETDFISERKDYMDAQKPINILAETLSVQARDTLVYLKQSSFEADLGLHESINSLKNNSDGTDYSKQVSGTGKSCCRSWIGVIAMTGGIKSIIWGLASALDDLNEKCRKDRTGSLKWRNDLLAKWEHYGEGFEYFVNICIKKLLIVDTFDEAVITERDVAASQYDSNATPGQYTDAELTEYNREEETEEDKFEQERDSETEEEKDETEQKCLYEDVDDADDEEDNGGTENDSLLDLHAPKDNVQHTDIFEIPYLNKSFLEKLLKGEKPEQATLLGELFMALAGIVKLKHLSSSPKVLMSTQNCQSSSLAFMKFHIGAAHWLISEAATMIRCCGEFSHGWLVGIIRYLESIGSFIPYMNPLFPCREYVKLINLHLQAMADICFVQSTEIKNSFFHEVRLNNDNLGSPESTMHNKASRLKMDSFHLNDLKAALQSSFAMLLRKPLRLHLFMALQSIEKALTGAWTGYNIASQLQTGCQYGGRVGRIVAAGVECLDLAFDSVSGPKRMKLLAKYSSSFVPALLNIIVHLQGPHIFFIRSLDQFQDTNYVDPALVILSCVEVLSKVASWHKVIPMSASQVGQSFAFPAVLFQHLCQFKSTQCVIPCTMSLQNQAIDIQQTTLVSGGTSAVVRKLSVELYISCCRLLCALLRHRKSESGHCIALLGDSLRMFLFCLEIVELDTLENMNGKCWNMEGGLKCASWLRRVYEEMGQHKDTFGRYCAHILSDYISVLSGCGPANSGLNREIDEALRPGAYALVDACSLEDLQQLHVVLGEGPRRTALQTLRNDYERHFKYTGKI